MRVSIITPTYNRADLLSETIDSILDQNYPDLEYIVLDDGSVDDTPALLTRYGDRIQVERHPNMGETATVNRGFELVTGDIVCVVCSDDPLLPQALQQIVDAFEKHPDAVAVYPDWAEIDPEGHVVKEVRLPEYDIGKVFRSLSMGLGPGTFFRRHLLKELKGRNPDRVYCGDMEFWMLAMMKGRFVHLPQILATHRTHPGSASVEKLSGKFAREWIDTWKTVADHPDLSPEIAATRPRLMALTHLIASRHYTGKDYASASLLGIKGFLLSTWADLTGKLFWPKHLPEVEVSVAEVSASRNEFAQADDYPDVNGIDSVVPVGHIPEGYVNVLQISAVDLIGAQVNGYMLHQWLAAHSHGSRMLVSTKRSNDENVRAVGSRLRRGLGRMDSLVGMTAVFPFISRSLVTDPWVRSADVVNLQLIHAAPSISLLELPRLSRAKRVVLSVHDMFFMTGHCVYALECDRWLSGCGQCPDLDRPVRVPVDMTALNWKLKNSVFKRANIDVVVGSSWQEQRVRQSPILNRFPCHMIPYGVNTEIFRPINKVEARRKLGLPEDAQVIAFRISRFPGNYKGSEYIEEVLRRFQPRRKTVLVTFEALGGMEDLREKYIFHELGWVVDSEKIALGLQAADIFLMPSRAEAFGLMAVESMACGTPPIVFDGTALPDTIGGPECGGVITQGDISGYVNAMERCLDNPDQLESYRRNGLRHVMAKHGFDDYARRYLELYQELAKEDRH